MVILCIGTVCQLVERSHKWNCLSLFETIQMDKAMWSYCLKMKTFLFVSMFYFQEADGTLDCISMALTCTFNRWGTLLAVGCNDGRIVIWDFLTRGIAKIISAHIHPVCSLW